MSIRFPVGNSGSLPISISSCRLFSVPPFPTRKEWVKVEEGKYKNI
jgi:hypothetical protein